MAYKQKSRNNSPEEFHWVFYNTPFQWSDVLTHDHLKVLMVTGQNISSLDGIETLINLEELWVTESKLENANAVQCSNNLQKLYLYNNVLTEVPEVQLLRKLQVLWLSGNFIRHIRNISGSKLNELNLANNEITEIGSELTSCDKLASLNLSGNPIRNVFTVSQLKYLKSLRKLQFYDLIYRTTPITKYVNYRSFVIHTLPQLESLDNFSVYPEEITNVNNYYKLKNCYYSMQNHSALYNYFNETMLIREIHQRKLRPVQERIANGVILLKKGKLKRLVKRKLLAEINESKLEIDNIEREKTNRLYRIGKNLELQNEMLYLEQKLFGSVKFVDLKDNVKILNLLQNVIQGFICPLMNSYLWVRLDHSIQIVDRRTVLKCMNMLNLISNHTNSRRVNFFMLTPREESEDTMKFNLDSLKDYYESKEDLNTGFIVTNSFAYADRFCLNSMMSNMEEFNSRNVVPKVLLLACLKSKKKLDTIKHAQVLNRRPVCNSCRAHRADIFSVVPVFIIEYQYQLKMSKKIVSMYNKNSLLKSQDSETNLIEQLSETNLNQCTILGFEKIKTKTWENLSSITLSKSCISKFDCLAKFPNVLNLDVSYNRFEDLGEINRIFPNLIKLLAPFNQIKSVQHLTEMKLLTELDVSSNCLQSFISTLASLSGKTEIIKLKIDSNPFNDLHSTHHLFHFAKMMFPGLKIFNDQNIAENVRASTTIKLQSRWCFKKYKLEKDTVFGRFADMNLRSDNCVWFVGENKAEHLGMHGSCPENHVTLNHLDAPLCIYLADNLQIMNSIVLAMETQHVRYLTISNTLMSGLVVAEPMSLLEVMDLPFNNIVTLDRKLMSCMQYLVRLNLMGNYIFELNFMAELNLPCLKYLNLSKNFIQTVNGVEHLSTIEELHLSWNLISEWSELRILKSFNKIKIFDYRGNSIKNAKMLKKFILYHLNNLKYLNGEAVKDCEVDEAKVFYRKILDVDYLMKVVSPPEDLYALTQLNVVNSSVTQIILPMLDNVTSVNLEHNSLKSFSSLVYLKNLKSLCLSNNQISSFADCTAEKYCDIQCFDRLEVLYLNMNHITNLKLLELYKAPNLIALFLQDNDLISIKGLQKLENLKHLVLDRNKIRIISQSDVANLIGLKKLYIENNLVNNLRFVAELKSLKSLFLAYNKITKSETLHSLSLADKVKELTFHGNPLCFNTFYMSLVNFLPNLDLVDGIPVGKDKLQTRIAGLESNWFEQKVLRSNFL